MGVKHQVTYSPFDASCTANNHLDEAEVLPFIISRENF